MNENIIIIKSQSEIKKEEEFQKTFNILKDLQILLKRESSLRHICKYYFN